MKGKVLYAENSSVQGITGNVMKFYINKLNNVLPKN